MMKKVTRLLSLVMTVCMSLSLSVPAFAASAEDAQNASVGTIIYDSESPRRLPVTTTRLYLSTSSWATLYSDNNWLNEVATITNNLGNPGSIYVKVVAYDKDDTKHTIVSKSPEIGVGASYETPVIDKDYAKYTVSIMAASKAGTYSIRYHD